MTVIAVANQKGGVGKTTTVVNLGAALQELGKRVLLVDLDPQGSLTVHLGIKEPEVLPANCGHVLQAAATGARSSSFADVLVQTPAGIDLIPAGRQLAVAESLLHAALGRDFILRDILAPLRTEYDFIIVDCLPTMNLLVVNALAAADAILIPVQTDYLATQGLTQILQTVATIRERLNPHLEVLGILLTMVEVRTSHSRQVIAAVQRSLQGKLRIFDTMVRLQVGFKESSKVGVSVLRFDPRSSSAAAYRALALEVVAAVEEMGLSAGPSLGTVNGKSVTVTAIDEFVMAALAQAGEAEREIRQSIDLADDPPVPDRRPVAGPAPASDASGEVCQFLGLASDRTRRLAQASDHHQCWASSPATAVDVSTQRRVCLHSWHHTCPRFAQHGLAASAQGNGTSLGRLRSLLHAPALGK